MEKITEEECFALIGLILKADVDRLRYVLLKITYESIEDSKGYGSIAESVSGEMLVKEIKKYLTTFVEFDKD